MDRLFEREDCSVQATPLVQISDAFMQDAARREAVYQPSTSGQSTSRHLSFNMASILEDLQNTNDYKINDQSSEWVNDFAQLKLRNNRTACTWAEEYLQNHDTSVRKNSAPNFHPSLMQSNFSTYKNNVPQQNQMLAADFVRNAVENLPQENSVLDEVFQSSIEDHLREKAEQIKYETNLDDFSPFNLYEKRDNYEFNSENPFKSISDAFEKGLERLQLGDLANAILLFEEAVSVNPCHVEAWQYLGTTHADNECDEQAISALRQCVLLQSNNLSALLQLAISCANEGRHSDSLSHLSKWLRNNEKYSSIKINEMETSASDSWLQISSDADIANAEEALVEAVRLNPHSVDVDVQTCLGVLYTLKRDASKAIDCFMACVAEKPNDAHSWNRLGASLANADRSSEVFPAYKRALSIRPGFIRARYNLSIACSNIGAYREAAEHLIVALDSQRSGFRASDGSRSQMSDSLWNALVGLAFKLELDQQTHSAILEKNIDKLKNYFKV